MLVITINIDLLVHINTTYRLPCRSAILAKDWRKLRRLSRNISKRLSISLTVLISQNCIFSLLQPPPPPPRLAVGRANQKRPNGDDKQEERTGAPSHCESDGRCPSGPSTNGHLHPPVSSSDVHSAPNPNGGTMRPSLTRIHNLT